jgi:hypothetical protein
MAQNVTRNFQARKVKDWLHEVDSISGVEP